MNETGGLGEKMYRILAASVWHFRYFAFCKYKLTLKDRFLYPINSYKSQALVSVFFSQARECILVWFSVVIKPFCRVTCTLLSSPTAAKENRDPCIPLRVEHHRHPRKPTRLFFVKIQLFSRWRLRNVGVASGKSQM